jgi:hypothetical protein
MSEKKNSIGTVVFGWCCLIGFFVGGVWVGDYRAEKKTEEQITQAYEEQYRKELDAVYELLSAQAFSIRANMNLSLKTNHYLTHEFHEKLCPDCIEHYKYIVEKMPEMPERDQAWFEFFNKTLTEISEEITNE